MGREVLTVMDSKVKRIGVLTSGGDAPGMNAAVRAVVRTAVNRGVECVGIRRGWNGLINNDFVRLDAGSVSPIIDKGGTMLYTARSMEFMHPQGRERAIATCKLLGLDGIVAIGGDGTFRGALALSRQVAESGHKLSVVGIPATIDNDIGCSHYTIGFDTACNTAIECIDKLRDTMQSHERCSVVEVMGRHAGYLALYVGISVGATAVLIPERPVDFQQDVVERIRRARLAGSTHYMVVVAEGAGSAIEIGKRIHEEVGIDPRVTVLGHIQRGGAPTARDRETASRMGYQAVHALIQGRGNRILGTQDGRMVDIDMEEALAMTKQFQMDRYEMLQTLSNGGLASD
jgi:6-phosphofructokinase 1